MQRNRSKRYRAAAQQVDQTKNYSLADSVATLKKFSPAKFDQTVTLSFRLGVDPKQSDQMVRGTCPLPHGSGKQVRVLVFAEGEAARAAKEAGAEFVGMKDLIQKCQEGFQDFDVAIATPAAMAEVRKLGESARSARADAQPADGDSDRRHCQGGAGGEKLAASNSSSTRMATLPCRLASFPLKKTRWWRMQTR